VRCELPNAKLYKFDGAVVNQLDSTQPHIPLTIDNLMLRGCTLRKTSWAVRKKRAWAFNFLILGVVSKNGLRMSLGSYQGLTSRFIIRKKRARELAENELYQARICGLRKPG